MAITRHETILTLTWQTWTLVATVLALSLLLMLVWVEW